MIWLQPLLDWINANPNWAWFVIFWVAALDSLFVVGVFLPGAVVMFGIGALIALGALDYQTCLVIAAVGAILGDSFNYWLGRHFRERLLRWRPVASNPVAIERGKRFFEKHGGKSVLVGRFVGLLRPLTPAIAGIYGMALPWFLLIDTVAGISWSVFYTTIGVAFGASLSLAAEVTTRLAVLLLALLVFLWLLVWLVRLAVNLVQEHAEGWVHALLDWSHRHRTVGRLGAWLADPKQPETPGVALLAIILLAASALWLWLWWELAAQHPAPFDALAYQALKDLHTPGGL
ncbi:MAG: DedA family protein, partial [Hydrocarboniphaga effusa]|nr:DedA family protein [Hydrocarboniphaga effusa]